MKKKFQYIIKGKKINNKNFKVVGTTYSYKNAKYKADQLFESKKYSSIEIHRTETVKIIR